MSKSFTPETFLHAVDVALLKRFFNYLLPEGSDAESARSWPEETWDDTTDKGKKGARGGKIIAKLKALDKGAQCRCYQEMRDIYYVSRSKYQNMNIVQFVRSTFPNLLHGTNLDEVDVSCEDMAVIAYLHFNESQDPYLRRHWKAFKWDALKTKSGLSHTTRFAISDNDKAEAPDDETVEKAAKVIGGELSRYLLDKNMCGEFVQVENIPSPSKSDVLRLLIHYSGLRGTRLTWDDAGIRPGRDNNVGTIQVVCSCGKGSMTIRSDFRYQTKAVHRECARIVSEALFGKEANNDEQVKIDLSGFSTLQGAREILKRTISTGVVSRISAIRIFDPTDGGDTIELACGSGCAYERLGRRLKDADRLLSDGGLVVSMVALEIVFNAMPDKPKMVKLMPTSYGKSTNEELNELIEKTIEELGLVKHAPKETPPSLFDLFTLPDPPRPV